jgi:hypothetical protein
MPQSKTKTKPGQEADSNQPSREELLERCSALAECDDILAVIDGELRNGGFAGSTNVPKVVYLATVTRLFKRPVSVGVLGASSAGKSFAIERGLAFHPPEAFVYMTAMSEKALIYLDEPLEHRVLVVAESAGLSGDFLAYAVRSLLSEGKLEYVYTDFDRRRTRRISKPGPTGLILSTAGSVDHELATRLITPSVVDDPELTRAIMLAAAEENAEAPAYDEFHDLQRYLAAGGREVTIPFAHKLAQESDPRAVRMRRDFPAMLELIRAHALLHQRSREADAKGRIVASTKDYEVVYGLIGEMVARAAERSVEPLIRETVDALFDLYHVKGGADEPVSILALAKSLGITRTSANRRVNRAITLGFIRDVSGGGRGRAKELAPGDAMPKDTGVLPSPEAIG